jgi:hypothetical protein
LSGDTDGWSAAMLPGVENAIEFGSFVTMQKISIGAMRHNR